MTPAQDLVRARTARATCAEDTAVGVVLTSTSLTHGPATGSRVADVACDDRDPSFTNPVAAGRWRRCER